MGSKRKEKNLKDKARRFERELERRKAKAAGGKREDRGIGQGVDNGKESRLNPESPTVTGMQEARQAE